MWDLISFTNDSEILDGCEGRKSYRKYVRRESLFLLRTILTGFPVIVFSVGRPLPAAVKVAWKLRLFEICKIIAVDGAAIALASSNIVPDVVVSDLDADINDLIHVGKQGSIIVLRRKMEGTEKVLRFFKKCIGPIVFYDSVAKYDANSDLDAAVYLACKFHCRKVVLLGFDVSGNVSIYYKHGLRHTGSRLADQKRFTETLRRISWILEKFDMEAYGVLEENLSLKGVSLVSYLDLPNIL